MASTKVHKLSDGTTLRVRTTRILIGTQLTEVPSRKRPAGSLLWMDGGMYVLTGNKNMHKITNPDYSYASTEAEAARLALAFFVDSAEATIKHATEEGIPVEDCY
jgi:hypothetical protein